MIEPVVAPAPTGKVDVFLDGLIEGSDFMPFIWTAVVVAIVATHFVARITVTGIMDRRKARKLRRANA